MAVNFSRRSVSLNEAIDKVFAKAEGVALEQYRKAVWAVFVELVYTTPQFSGRAAANWNIGVDAPDFTVDYSLGEQPDIVDNKKNDGAHIAISPKRVGDNKWASEALERNKYKLRQIKSKSKVYISNGVKGDVDEGNGRSSPYYLADLQDPTYWARRLREVNQPYETVSQVLATESWRRRLHENLIDKAFFE